MKKRRTKLFFNRFLEGCRQKYHFEGLLIEPHLSETVNYLICNVPFGLYKLRENQLIAKGCNHIQKACENMKKCYVQYADHFGFHSFFNDNVFTIAVIMMVLFLVSIILALVAQILLPNGKSGDVKFLEYLIFIIMGFTGTSLLVFSLQVNSDGENMGVKKSTILLILRVLWHLGSFFLTMAFHIYMICFTFRFVKWVWVFQVQFYR